MGDTSTQVTRFDPFTEENWNELNELTKLYGPPGVYQGPRVAPLDPNQIAGANNLAGYATGQGQEFIDAAQAANMYWMNPQNMNVMGVPGSEAMRNDIRTSVGQTLAESWLPNITSGSILAGGLGGDRQGIAQGLAGQRAAEEVAGAIGKLDLGIYGNLIEMQNAAISRAPQLLAAGAVPSELLSQAGAVFQNQDQANITADMQKFNEEQNAEQIYLNNLRANMGLIPSATTTSVNPSDPSFINTTLGALSILKGLGVDFSEVYDWGKAQFGGAWDNIFGTDD